MIEASDGRFYVGTADHQPCFSEDRKLAGLFTAQAAKIRLDGLEKRVDGLTFEKVRIV